MIFKIVIDIFLVGTQSVGIIGAEVASAVCYFFALIINLSVLKYKNLVRLDLRLFVVILLSFGTYFSKFLFKLILGTNINYYLSFFTTVLVVVLLYSIFMFVLYRKEIFRIRKQN